MGYPYARPGQICILKPSPNLLLFLMQRTERRHIVAAVDFIISISGDAHDPIEVQMDGREVWHRRRCPPMGNRTVDHLWASRANFGHWECECCCRLRRHCCSHRYAASAGG